MFHLARAARRLNRLSVERILLAAGASTFAEAGSVRVTGPGGMEPIVDHALLTSPLRTSRFT
jgi:hypothetical protein